MIITTYVGNPGEIKKRVDIELTDEQIAACREQSISLQESAIREYYGRKLIEVQNAFTSEGERNTWSQQLVEATAYLNATTNKKADVKTPLIDLLIISRGLNETKEELATKIVDNSTKYAEAISTVLGEQKQALLNITFEQITETQTWSAE